MDKKNEWQNSDSPWKDIEMNVELDIFEDIPEELEDFIFLSRLGLFKEAHEAFKQNLQQYCSLFPVFIEYADMLLEERLFQTLSKTLAKPPSGAKFSSEQILLLNLLKGLSDAYMELEENKEKEHPLDLESMTQALKLAQDWHREVSNEPNQLSDLKIHTLEVYLSIIVLAEGTTEKLDEKYYQPPGSRNPYEKRWDGFWEWCMFLNKTNRFWEAYRIFKALIRVLCPKDVDRLFWDYFASLKILKDTDATTIAKVATTNAYLFWTCQQMKRNRHCGVSSDVFDIVTETKALLLDIFGGNTEMRCGRFNEWKENLIELNQTAGRDWITKPGPTPPSRAVEESQEGIVSVLVGTGADVDSGDEVERTPLSWAADKGHEDIVKLLLGSDADPDARRRCWQTPLAWAAEMEYESQQDFGRQTLLDAGMRQRSSRTPLSWAAEKGNESIVKLLIDNGADPDLEDKNRRTPLSWAASYGHQDTAKLLLDGGADPDSKDVNSRTPLSWAASYGHQDTAKLLLAGGADPDSKDVNSRTPLSWAASYGHQDTAKLLLARGADPDSKDVNSRTPLSWAASYGHQDTAKLLLARGADPDSKDINRRTPLSWASSYGHQDTVKLLLDNGADSDPEDKNG